MNDNISPRIPETNDPHRNSIPVNVLKTARYEPLSSSGATSYMYATLAFIDDAIQNPKANWDEEKEKEYLTQMKELYQEV